MEVCHPPPGLRLAIPLAGTWGIPMADGLGNTKYAPCPLLVNMVTAGHLGVKSGSGFYIHQKGSKELIISPMFKK